MQNYSIVYSPQSYLLPKHFYLIVIVITVSHVGVTFIGDSLKIVGWVKSDMKKR